MAKDRGENCCLRIDAERAEKAMSERPLYDLPREAVSRKGQASFSSWLLVRQKRARLSIGPP
jgi:hypothetical protein